MNRTPSPNIRAKKGKPRRDDRALEAFKAKALLRLAYGTPPARVARGLGEDIRFVQRKAQQWARQGLLADNGPLKRGQTRNYSLAERGARWLELHGYPTAPYAVIGRTPRGKRGLKHSDPVPDHGLYAQGLGLEVCEDGGWFAGSHYQFWNAKVKRSGRDVLDLLPDSKKGLRHLKRTRWGYLYHPEAGQVLIERFRADRPRATGSLNVRFDLKALAGESPFQHRTRARRIVGEVLERFTKERAMEFEEPRERSKAHFARMDDPDAIEAARLKMRVTTKDCFGSTVAMDGSHGPELETMGDNAPKSMAARGRMASNVEKLVEEARETKAVLEAQTKAIAELVAGQKATADAIQGVRQVLEERLPKPGPRQPQNSEPPPLDEDSGMFR